MKNHDRSGQPDREERLHKVQEDGHLKNRDDADKFNFAMDDENQCLIHILHCNFGSTLIISHSSVFPTAIIASFDSSLKGLND